MPSPRKVLFSIFGVFLALLAGGIFLFLQSESSPQEESAPKENVIGEEPIPTFEGERASEEAPSNTKLFASALQKNDESLCHQISGQELRSECFDRVRMEAALKVREIDLCASISEEKIRKYCQENVIFTTALFEKNPHLCLQIEKSPLQERCFEETETALFASASDTDDCQKLPEGDKKNSCLDSFRLQRLEVLVSSVDCRGFLTASARGKCEDYFRHEEAIAKKDPTLCLKIQDPEERTHCEASMKMLIKTEERTIGMLQGKSEYCSEFQDGELKTQCLNEANYYAAKLYRSTEYCGKIQSESFADRCREELTALNDEYWQQKARAETKPEYCDKLSSVSQIEYCKAML